LINFINAIHYLQSDYFSEGTIKKKKIKSLIYEIQHRQDMLYQCIFATCEIICPVIFERVRQ